MLVLTRRQKEGIKVKTPSGEEIIIIITKVGGNYTRVGVACKKNTYIERLDTQIEIDESLESFGQPHECS